VLLACGSQDGSKSPPASGSSPATGCSRSCLFQYRDVNVCNELGPIYDYGPWLDNCLNDACENLVLDSNFQIDPVVPCTSHREFRYVQTHLGTCGGQSTGMPLVDDGDAGRSNGEKGAGAQCNADAECLTRNCVSTDNHNFVCADSFIYRSKNGRRWLLPPDERADRSS
jgi:hypothetical protein